MTQHAIKMATIMDRAPMSNDEDEWYRKYVFCMIIGTTVTLFVFIHDVTFQHIFTEKFSFEAVDRIGRAASVEYFSKVTINKTTLFL